LAAVILHITALTALAHGAYRVAGSGAVPGLAILHLAGSARPA
jgi:hypothetical protein